MTKMACLLGMCMEMLGGYALSVGCALLLIRFTYHAIDRYAEWRQITRIWTVFMRQNYKVKK